jgi:streptogramin lyase
VLMHGCRRLLPILVLAGALAAPAAAPASVTEFSANLTADSAPADITRGPDGNLWFTQKGGSGGIGRITPGGAVTEYTAGPTPGFSTGQVPSHIATGSDGALWFTEEGLTGQIGRLDPATGNVTEFAAGITPNRAPTGIAKGPDGNLWFTERGGSGAIGRITPTGMVTEYTTGLTANSAPTDIAAGADGNLWFTESANPGRIGRVEPATGTISEFAYGLTANSAPGQITAASNGKLYFTQGADPGRIGRIKTDGRIEQYTSGLTANARPGDIAEGGDGALWFTEAASPGRVGRLWPGTDTISELPGGLTPGLTADATPAGITRGPDGNVWFTESANPARIGRVTVPPLADVSTPVSLGDGGVRLKASVGPNSQATTYFIEWGPDSGFDHKTAVLSAGSGAAKVSVGTEVTLPLDANYHVRLTATNASGTAISADLPFYLAADGTITKEKPVSEGTSTVDAQTGDDQGQDEQGSTPPAPTTGEGDEDGLAPATAPELGHAVTLQPLSGHVFVKPPGARNFVPLALGATVRVGSLVDTRHGKVVLESARDAHGRTQKGTFWGAIFQIRQTRRGRGMTELALRGGSFARCGVKAGASVVARDSGGRRRAIRRLWGKDRHSRFRTHGRDSVATVRGTRWVTTDRCDGTLTRVKKGAVMVRDLRRHRSHLVTAGHAYLARHRHR